MITDSVLNEYRVPAGFKLKVLHPKDAMKRFGTKMGFTSKQQPWLQYILIVPAV
jgi:hypothetical protein